MPFDYLSLQAPAAASAASATAPKGATRGRACGRSAAEDIQFAPKIYPTGTRAEHEFLSNWQAHVDAGRIGTGSGQTAEHLMRHLRNEEILLGRNPSARRSVRVK